MTATGHSAVAEDFIVMMDEIGSFDVHLGLKLINRSKELPTAPTPERLLTDVLEDWVRANFAKLSSFRVSRYMQGREIPMIVEALKPLCERAFVKLNVMLAIDRDYLFLSRDYIKRAGRAYYEEAPSVTFTRYLNEMERHCGNGSEIYAREVPRIAEVHALNRVASIMPPQFHRGFDGTLQQGESVEQMVQREKADVWRKATGGRTMADLLAEAGLA